MFILDRLYGELNFPSLIKDALFCPGLLRLREIRMANIPFFSFPSFASASRYEHSLGVCYLAGLFSDSTDLKEKDKIELMLAGLYHDVATPPFAHAMEEVLNDLYKFNHEEKLRDLIIGKHDDIGGHRVQVYLGRMIKLHEICQSAKGRKLRLDVMRIADLAAGVKNDKLGDVICSKDIDLDNIDNVVRAASAMGVTTFNRNIAEIISKSFVFDGDKLCLDKGVEPQLINWQEVRSILYGMIFSSITDFSMQTMLKDSVRILAGAEDKFRLRKEDWLLTDEQFVYERLMKYPPTLEIVKAMKLGKTYTCLSYFMVNGEPLLNNLSSYIDSVKKIAEEVYLKFLHPKLKEIDFPRILVNFYVDKRDRSIKRPLLFFNQKSILKNKSKPTKLLIGVFTPQHKNWNKEALSEFYRNVKELDGTVALMYIKISKDKYPFVKGVTF